MKGSERKPVAVSPGQERASGGELHAGEPDRQAVLRDIRTHLAVPLRRQHPPRRTSYQWARLLVNSGVPRSSAPDRTVRPRISRLGPRSARSGRRARATNAWNRATGAFRPRGVRISLIGLPLAAVFLAAFTSACSAQNPADGTLTGHLYGVGGPAPGLPRPWPGTVTLTGPGVHRDVPIGASATYSVTVPAGRYTLVAHSPLYGSGAGLCQAAGVAMVTSGHTIKADVLCQMS